MKSLLLTAAALLIVSPALAGEPVTLTDGQMDRITAGAPRPITDELSHFGTNSATHHTSFGVGEQPWGIGCTDTKCTGMGNAQNRTSASFGEGPVDKHNPNVTPGKGIQTKQVSAHTKGTGR